MTYAAGKIISRFVSRFTHTYV